MLRLRAFAVVALLFAALNPARLLAEQIPTLLSAKPPVYPLAAEAAGIEGAVMLSAVIGKDGKAHNVKAIGGHVELRQAAVDAVYSWQYQPYTDHGVPVDTPTTVTVNFTMRNKKDKALARGRAQAALAKQASSEGHAGGNAEPPNNE